jgi:hypothetical protein
LSWAIPLMTAGGVATGGAVVAGGGGTVVGGAVTTGGAVVGGGGVVVLELVLAAAVGLTAVAWEFDMSPSPRARPPATRATITAMRIPSRLVT